MNHDEVIERSAFSPDNINEVQEFAEINARDVPEPPDCFPITTHCKGCKRTMYYADTTWFWGHWHIECIREYKMLNKHISWEEK